MAVYALNPDDGSIGDLVYYEEVPMGSGVVPGAQDDSHVHTTYVVNDFVFVVDLGADAIYHYTVQDGTLIKDDTLTTACTPGTGPRHMAFDTVNNIAYVNDELAMSVEVFEMDPTSGALTHVALVPYDLGVEEPGVEQKGAEMALHPTGRFLYVSHRGTGAIIVYQAESASAGYLEQVQTVLAQLTELER